MLRASSIARITSGCIGVVAAQSAYIRFFLNSEKLIPSYYEKPAI